MIFVGSTLFLAGYVKNNIKYGLDQSNVLPDDSPLMVLYFISLIYIKWKYEILRYEILRYEILRYEI